MTESREQHLDQVMRRRLRRLAAAEELPVLDPDARARVVAEVLARVASRERQRRRMAWLGGGGVLLAAAAAAVLSLRPSAASAPAAAGRRLARTAGVAPGAPAPAEPAGAPRRCAGFEGAASPIFEGEGSWRRVDLGRALLVRGEADEAQVQEASPCRTVVRLTRGLVAVHARELGGGELRVSTDLGEVVVHGTAFSVRRDAQGLVVEVVEGTVVVERPGRPPVSVSVDRRWSTASAAGPERAAALEPPARSGLRSLLGLDPPLVTARAAEPAAGVAVASRAPVTREATPPPAVAPPAVTPLTTDELVRMAEAARRDGDLVNARRLYREAGARRDPTAEAAWLALARLELRTGNAARARGALDERRRRFGAGSLGAEALWIGVRAARASGDVAAAQRDAAELVRRYPRSAQAEAARQTLGVQEDR